MRVILMLKAQAAADNDFIALSAVADIFLPDGPADACKDIVFPLNGQQFVEVTALEVYRAVQAKLPKAQIQMLGESAAWVHRTDPKPNRVWHAVKTAVVSVILFIGAGFAILAYHVDVDMPKIHEGIAKVFLSSEDARNPYITVPYSIGIGLGMAVFYLPIRRNKKVLPSPVRINYQQYQQKIDDCLKRDRQTGR